MQSDLISKPKMGNNNPILRIEFRNQAPRDFEIKCILFAAPCTNWKFLQAIGWRRRLVLQIFLDVERNHSTILLVAAVVAILFKYGNLDDVSQKSIEFHKRR